MIKLIAPSFRSEDENAMLLTINFKRLASACGLAFMLVCGVTLAAGQAQMTQARLLNTTFTVTLQPR